ncbi:MAG TPA: hypothetical protein PKG77_08645 [Phycisphaerae bacterium]|nr:hypothetical protein [Phycisphaerae bacterium]HQL76366.1 hypothetical protein [Phycisphaerae bacterium]
MKHAASSTIDIASVLQRAKHMLDAGQSEHALEVLAGCGQHSRVIENAKGVCLLRLGRLEAALKVFRELVFPGGAFTIPDETPTVFRANYVTTLLLMDNLTVGMQLLREIPERRHPLVEQLDASVRRWKRSLPWWRRVLTWIGLYPARSFRLDSLPGALWVPESLDGPRPLERAA